MNKERNSNGMSRRQFLQTSAEFAASAMFLSPGSAPSFAALNTSTQENSIPLVTLNNGLPMPQLATIGKKHNKTIAQVSLRWHYQRGIIAIPRSSQKAHISENLNIFDFSLAESDMAAIATLDLKTTQFPEWS